MEHHFNVKDVVITFGEVLIEGYAADSVVTIDQAEDDVQLYIGADGKVTRSMNNNESATVELQLSASSPSNPQLSAMSKLDRTTGQGVRPLVVKDLNGSSVFTGLACIARRPRREIGKTVTARTWKFLIGKLIDFDGASNAPSNPAP